MQDEIQFRSTIDNIEYDSISASLQNTDRNYSFANIMISTHRSRHTKNVHKFSVVMVDKVEAWLLDKEFFLTKGM